MNTSIENKSLRNDLSGKHAHYKNTKVDIFGRVRAFILLVSLKVRDIVKSRTSRKSVDYNGKKSTRDDGNVDNSLL